ncbi:MAG TPA: ATP-binding protein [Abditibacteriaceae bacterium]|jgi:signal transduction histidine kinase
MSSSISTSADAALEHSSFAEVIEAINNPERLAALGRSELLDTPPEAAFDRLTQLARHILHTPVALVSLIDRDRQFFKSIVGGVNGMEPPRETSLEYAFCKHSLASGSPLVIADARLHPSARGNLAVTQLGIMAYAGIPLTTSEGHTLGSFCALDTVPREWTPEEIAILQDLAAMALTEIELRLAARKLRDSLVELQRTEAQRDRLMHMIVHDLRTPLTSYLSGVMALGSLGELNQPQKEVLAIAISGGRSLQHMINDLLDVARMEATLSGTVPLPRTQISADALVSRAHNHVVHLATRHELDLRVCVAPDIPLLSVDAGLIERVLVNLLGNALKFTPSPGTVELVAEATADDVHFFVRDSGPGISPKEFERIFELFGQSATRRAGHEVSTGLGLTFCKLAVEAHGGKIWVESEEGKGSTFHVTLPHGA